VTTKEYNEQVDLLSDRLYRFALDLTWDISDAKDAVQDAFEMMWKERETIENKNMRSFLFTFVKHRFLNEKVRKEVSARANEVLWQETVNAKEYPDLKKVLNEAMDQIPVEERTAILLKDLEGYSYDEIAVLMNLQPVYIRKLVCRGRLALTKYLVSIENLL
jgi:RNA polymerase sigma factor (sigma-70 family)